MHFSFLPELLVFAFLYVPTLARFDFLSKRLVCIQDDLYEGFQNAEPEDIDPWCSSYLGLPEYTATRVGGTIRTTVVITTTTFMSYFQTTTLPTYLTTTTTTLDALRKRDASPEPTPAPSLNQLYQAAPILLECDLSEANRSVLASVSSACSCLFILPNTVDLSVTTTVTRTQSAIDYQSTPVYVTVPSSATLTETVYPSGSPYNNVTSPGSNGTFSASFIFTSYPISGTPSSRQNTSSFPVASNSRSVSLPSSATAPLSIPSCVVQDGLVVAQRNGERFQALCFTNFTGPTTAGLDVPTYRSCLQQCAHNNDGFSLLNCYGVSYFPERLGPNCYLKTEDEVAAADYNPNYRVVSGKLLLNVTNDTSSYASFSRTPIPAINSTLNVGPTGPTAASSTDYPYNGTWTPGPTDPRSRSTWPRPTGYPTNDTSFPEPTAPFSSTNSSTASQSPSPSLNSTLMPSITASPSSNGSITPSSSPTDSYNGSLSETIDPRSGRPTMSANATSGFPTPSGNISTSGFPEPSSNGTSGFPIPTSNGTSSGFPTPSANITTSGFPELTSNGTSSGFPAPTSNGTSSGFPTPSANSSTCLFTNWMTSYTTQSVCESYVTIYTTAPSRSIGSTRTITETYTIAV